MENAPIEIMIDALEDFCCQKFGDENKKNIMADLIEEARIDLETRIYKRHFNEILLLCNESRVTEEFFWYFTEYRGYFLIKELAGLISRFKIHSMLEYGNFKFAFNKLTKSKDIDRELGRWLKGPEDIAADFNSRPDPILGIQKIERDKIFQLGYLIDDKKKEPETIQKGIFNSKVYLTSDYMDVYVATSMRDEFDFISVYDLCENVFSHRKVQSLHLRYFDPTQSYHEDRVAKGLIEGLMLKRAKCTIFVAQESDSLGKDSELAATLAQGKPVIAFIPKYDSEDKEYLDSFSKLPLKKLLDSAELYRKHVKDEDWEQYNKACDLMASGLDRKTGEDQIRKEIEESHIKFADFIKLVAQAGAEFYDFRALLFKQRHPLGLQIGLETGVANGVMVARSYMECAEVLYNVLTNQLEFEIILPNNLTGEDKTQEGFPQDDLNYLLCERKTKCAFRVVTTDDLLTNSFWNFYLEEEHE